MTVEKIAYLGPAGSFSHQAALQFSNKVSNFNNANTKEDDSKVTSEIEFAPQTSIASCFKAIESKLVDYSVVPLENSTNGQVAFTYDLLRNHFFPSALTADSDKKTADFEVVAEQFVTIHHCFMTGCDVLDKVTKVYSHPQVWSQCVNFFSKLSEQGIVVEKMDTSSTSKAANLVKDDIKKGVKDTAAISSSLASTIYGLEPLKRNIEDDKNNTTRFLVLGRRSANLRSSSDDTVLRNVTNEIKYNIQVGNDALQKEPQYVTFIAIRIQNENTGFLCDALSFFKKHKINLSAITTRPSQIVKWQYIFFIEFWGNSSTDINVQQCLSELEKNVIELKVIGSFKRDPLYFDNKVEANDKVI